MFRFYCTKCKKIKRVQSPSRVIELMDQYATSPHERTGMCKRHSERINVRVRPPVKIKPVPVTNIKSKRGK